MKQFQKIQWLACVLILILGIVGCESLAPDGRVGPTAPVDVATDSAQLANFWVGRGQNKFGVYMGTGVVQFQVPEGSFMVEYMTLLGIFQIVIKAEGDGAFLAIGLMEGDVVLNANIYQGDIPEDATPQIEKEGVKIFCWPGSPVIVSWGNVFVINPWIAVIVLIKDGEIITDNPDIVIIEIPQVEASEFTITTEVLEGCGSIGPSEISGIPAGASRSLKIRACTRLCADIVDVRVNGFPTPVQCLGNGDGHLVIHDIREDILVTARFGP